MLRTIIPPTAHQPRFSDGLLAFIIALVVTLIGIVISYWIDREPGPKVAYETIADTNVLDVHRRVEDLAISFRGQNVQERNLNLRVLTVRVSNTGGMNILEGNYDSEITWGMKFLDGEVIDARVVDSNSEFLSSRIDPQVVGVDTVSFRKVIFEKGKHFDVEALLLHSKDDIPSFFAVGKIAGIDQIPVVAQSTDQQEGGFFSSLFPGNFLTHAVRTLIYLPGSLIAFTVFILSLAGIEHLVSRWNAHVRRNRISRTLAIREIDDQEIRTFLVTQFGSGGVLRLKGILEAVTESKRITWLKAAESWSIRARFRDDGSREDSLLDDFDVRRAVDKALNSLTSIGVIHKGQNDTAIVDPAFTLAVNSLLEELSS